MTEPKRLTPGGGPVRIRRVLNNSVVMGVDDNGVEVIMLGAGIGFRYSRHDVVDPAHVDRTFLPESIGSTERLAAMVEEISIEAIAAAEEVMQAGRVALGEHITARIFIPLADHIGFALERAASGMAMTYPLRTEVALLYPAELEVGSAALPIIERRTGVRLPAVEAVPIAMHFVNAQLGSDDMHDYTRMTQALAQILEIVREEHGTGISEDSVAVARFVTHLRFLFARGRQRLEVPDPGREGPDPARVVDEAGPSAELLATMRARAPREHASALRIGALLERSFGWVIGDDELLYLSLHVARLTAAARES
ncbi:MAG TPA: PRD domain-containing protein [Cellulomonas sp.]